MSPRQFRAALLKLGIHSQQQAADILGIGRRSVIRYSHPRLGSDAPEVVARLIEAYLEHGIPAKYRQG